MLNQRSSAHISNTAEVFVTSVNALHAAGNQPEDFLSGAAEGALGVFCEQDNGLWETVTLNQYTTQLARENKKLFIGQKATDKAGKIYLKRSQEFTLKGFEDNFIQKAASRIGQAESKIVHNWIIPTDAAGNRLGGNFSIGFVNNQRLHPLYERMSFEIIITDQEASAYASDTEYIQDVVTKLVAKINNPQAREYEPYGKQIYTAAATATTGIGIILSTDSLDETFDIFIPRESQQATIAWDSTVAIDGSTPQEYILGLGEGNEVAQIEKHAKTQRGYTYQNEERLDLRGEPKYFSVADPTCYYTTYKIRTEKTVRQSAPTVRGHMNPVDIILFIEEAVPQTAEVTLDTVFAGADIKTITV